jgi:signal transduction histidine kinase
VTKPAGEPLTPAEDKLVSDLAAQAGLALRNLRLVEELKASRQRIVAAQDAERRRLERDIHDGAQQRLVTLSLALRIARARVDPKSDLAAALAKAAHALTDSLNELRELARGIHPAILTEEGLGGALVSLAERSSTVTTVASAPAVRLPAPVEATAYQVASHALASAVQAGARSVEVNAKHAAGTLIVEVTHDAQCPISPERMIGLASLRDRVAALNGRLEIEAPADRGTVVRAVIPCESY